MPIAPGQVVNGRYQIIRLLGQGGFGAVYQAHDLILNRPCALKENLETSEEVMRQFNREAQLLANLSHPNLPRVTDFFTIPGQGQYLVMDYVEGEDLQDMLDRTARPLPAGQALGWISQVCDALTHLHQHQPPIIHRDIKPGNIRITPRGQAMLVDFGIAKLYDRQTHTTAGARAFTPGYSPPEQYGKGSTDERSDIYALGATLYTLLTNQTPPDSVDLLTGNAPPLPPAHLVNPETARPVSLAVAQAMDPERTRRFRTVADFKAALQAAAPPLKTVAVGQTPPAPGRPSGQAPAGRKKTGQGRRRPWGSYTGFVFAGLAALLVTLLVASVVIWLAQGGGLAAIGRAPRQPTASVESGAAALQAPSPSPSPSFIPAPSLTPPEPPEPGAILIDLPAARIAFASDHSGDRKDRIYFYELQPGKYWLAPLAGVQHQFSTANPVEPLLGPQAVPVDETQERSWWPEWCDGNRTILFEAGDKQSESYQTIYKAPFDPLAGVAASDAPTPIEWSGYPMLGAPRCANRSPLALASARLDAEPGSWQLHSFDPRSPGSYQPVGDGFLPFGGYASFSGDDSWLALMHKDSPEDASYRLIQFQWRHPQQVSELPLDSRVYTAMYPSISPRNGQIAYACELQPETSRELGSWGLCLQDPNGGRFQILEQLGRTSGLRLGYNRFHVFTPRWSADGRWLAYASPKDGDWDIYLYLLEKDIEFNLTQALTGDQFHPSWSKP
jgi:serine/threonine protein kinase